MTSERQRYNGDIQHLEAIIQIARSFIRHLRDQSADGHTIPLPLGIGKRVKAVASVMDTIAVDMEDVTNDTDDDDDDDGPADDEDDDEDTESDDDDPAYEDDGGEENADDGDGDEEDEATETDDEEENVAGGGGI